MTIKALIFDMDGVIVDTEYCDYQIHQKFIKRENPQLDLAQADFDELVGLSYERLYREMKKLLETDESIDEIEKRFDLFNKRYYDQLNYRELFRKEIFQLLDLAKAAGLRLAVASSSRYLHILEILHDCKIFDYFDVIYSGEWVTESKPHPQIYQNVLAELAIQPHEAVTIEDSAHGIAAAKAAGIKTIAYQEERMTIDQSLADHKIKDFYEASDLLRGWLET